MVYQPDAGEPVRTAWGERRGLVDCKGWRGAFPDAAVGQVFNLFRPPPASRPTSTVPPLCLSLPLNAAPPGRCRSGFRDHWSAVWGPSRGKIFELVASRR